MQALRTRFLTAAKKVSGPLHEAGFQPVLIGGAATIIRGNERITKALTAHQIIVKPSTGRNRSSVISKLTIPETAEGMKDAISVDVGVNEYITPAFIQSYTEIIDTVLVAQTDLILTFKIISVTERVGETKIVADIYFCLSDLESKGRKVPRALREMIKEETWVKFWKMLPEWTTGETEAGVGTCLENLVKVGFPFPEEVWRERGLEEESKA